MRTAIAAFLAVSVFITVFAAPVAQASPTKVNVRIEGRTETLFEGPILTYGHNVRASSDAAAPATGRRCNGLNNGQNPSPGPTPTAASVDAMSILGEDFDGRWYGEPFEDYFVKRWGPDGQDEGSGAYWGLIVNDVFTNVGGCQYRLDEGDEVLWVYDAFKGRSALALFPEAAAYTAGPRPLTATAQLDVPFPVEVASYGDDEESVPPAAPGRTGSAPFPGAEVAPVLTDAQGFQRVDTADAATETTDPAGKTSITFTTPGWHRIKATVAGAGGESTVRSNRLDVCVPPAGPPLEGASGCGELPAADRVRVPPASAGEAETPKQGGPAIGQAPIAGKASQAAASVRGPVHITFPRLNRDRIGSGRVGVSWRVLDLGAGIEGWKISSKTLGRRGAGYVGRASGAGATSASVRLPLGATYRLRFTLTDLLGNSSAATIGKVVVPDGGRP
jgi:uncharacterized protein DUF4430